MINMNQQSDSTDLLGGYKPVDISHTMHNILQNFNKARINEMAPAFHVDFLRSQAFFCRADDIKSRDGFLDIF